MLAWGLYQYPDGVERSGQMKTYMNNLTFVLDYLAACDEGDTVSIRWAADRWITPGGGR